MRTGRRPVGRRAMKSEPPSDGRLVELQYAPECRAQQHGVDEQQLGGFGERAVVRLLGEGDDVALAQGCSTRNAFCASWSRASSHASPPTTSLSFGANTPTLVPLSSLTGVKTRWPSTMAWISPSVPDASQCSGSSVHPQHGAGGVLGPLALRQHRPSRSRTAAADRRPSCRLSLSFLSRRRRACRRATPDVRRAGSTFSPAAQRDASPIVTSVPPPRIHSRSRRTPSSLIAPL